MIYLSKNFSETVRGEKIDEGKTKIIYGTIDNAAEVLIESKDDITAGDGLKRDVIKNKSVLSTKTTCNCFQLLNNEGLPTHFIKQVDEKTFRAHLVEMIPIELVARRIATGSYLKRNPDIQEGTVFEKLVIEFFLKDDERHDPLMIWDGKEFFNLYEAKKPVSPATLLGSINAKDLFSGGDSDIWQETVVLLHKITKKVFLILEGAWTEQNVNLVDLKIECGYYKNNKILVADVIDNDSWRIWPGGDKTQMKDKQVYRNLEKTTTKALEAIKKNYAWVAKATAKFLN